MDNFRDINITSSRLIGNVKGYWESRKFPDYGFWIITEGKIFMKSESYSGVLTAGDIIFFFPDTLYECSYLEDSSIRYNHFLFESNNDKGVLQGERKLLYLNTPYHFKKLLDAGNLYDSKHPLGLILLKGAFADFIYNMTDIDINAELISILDDKKIRLIMIDRFIFDHINEDVTVETLAKHFGKSPHYFSKLVKESCGEPLGSRIKRIKMNHAKILLQETKLKIYQIAQSLGYSDSFSFSKAFKQHFRVTPSYFRENPLYLHNNSKVKS